MGFRTPDNDWVKGVLDAGDGDIQLADGGKN